MNEKIKELAEQAELPVIDGMWDYNSREILCRENGEWRAATPTEIISVAHEHVSEAKICAAAIRSRGEI